MSSLPFHIAGYYFMQMTQFFFPLLMQKLQFLRFTFHAFQVFLSYSPWPCLVTKKQNVYLGCVFFSRIQEGNLDSEPYSNNAGF